MNKEQFTQQFIEAAQGTCHSLNDILDMYFEDVELGEDDLDLEAVDDQIFVCDDCGWWCEAGDYAKNENVEGSVCEACGEYNYDEEGKPT